MFSRKSKITITKGVRLPENLSAECVGEACPNFKGQPCTNSELVWLEAGGPTEGRETDKPPFVDEAKFIIYSHDCRSGQKPTSVGVEVEIFKPDEVSVLEIVARAGRYGDQVHIKSNEEEFSVVTTVVSD